MLGRLGARTVGNYCLSLLQRRECGVAAVLAMSAVAVPTITLKILRLIPFAPVAHDVVCLPRPERTRQGHSLPLSQRFARRDGSDPRVHI